MVNLKDVEQQLKSIGCNFRGWGKSEVRELSRVMADDEVIKHCVNGRYEGGFALFAATNYRLLLIDRKPMFLTIEAIWYDKIQQVDFNHRLLNASICVSTPNKQMTFMSWNHHQMRGILLYTQEKSTEAKEKQEAARRAEEASRGEIVEQTPRPLLYAQPVYSQLEPHPAPEQAIVVLPAQPTLPTAASQFQQLASSAKAVEVYAATRLPFTRRRYFAPDNA